MTGWIVGLVVGVAFALLSFLYWYLAVTILTASAGASLGTGVLKAFGVDSTWALTVVGVVVAVIFAVAAIMLDLPKVLVIVNTAIAGATAIVAGVLLVIDRVDRVQLWAGGLYAADTDSWFWLLVAGVIAAIGAYAQVQSTVGYEPDLRTTWRPRAGGAT